MENYQQAFFTVPYRIFSLPGITISFLRFYETIFQFWHRDKECFLNNESLMDRIGVSSTSTIKAAFDFFEQHNEIIKIYKNGKRYLVSPQRRVEIRDSVDKSKSKMVNPIDKSNGDLSIDRIRPIDKSNYNNNNNNNNNNNKNSWPSDDDRHTEMSNFDHFWFIYPKKHKKQNAKKAWINKKCDESFLSIMDNVKHRMANEWNGKDKQYIPNPDSYLNAMRWNDELLEVDKHKTNKKGSRVSQAIGFAISQVSLLQGNNQ